MAAHETGPRRAVRALASVVAVIVGFVGGLGATHLPPRRHAEVSVDEALVSADAAVSRPGAEPRDQRPPDVDRTAAGGSAVAAVDAFLRAERAGDLAVSFALLSRHDREAFGSPAAWVAAHAHLPPLTGHRLGAATPTGDRVEVAADVDLRAGLDEVAGLVPARARSTWVAVAEDSGWRVSYADSRLEAVHPPPAGAERAVRAWARARQSCGAAGGEHRSGLLADAALAERLCGATGTVRTAGSTALDDPVDAAMFATAFGDELVAAARVVRLESPRRLRAVVAPVGTDWLVVGVLADR